MVKTALIIQARYGSSRLPGKILLPMGKDMRKDNCCGLDYVAQNALKVKNIDVVCFAISDDEASDKVADYLAQHYPVIHVMRGDEKDVLARYYHCACQVEAKYVMRITSDCPVFDPSLASDMVALFHASDLDYLTNNYIASFPHGVDAEIMRFEALSEAFYYAKQSYQREHVTPFIRDNSDFHRGCLFYKDADESCISQRWTLDYVEDLDFLDRLMNLLFSRNLNSDADFKSIIKALKKRPDIMEINQKYQAPRQLLLPTRGDVQDWQFFEWQ